MRRATVLFSMLFLAADAAADPCGMVPPIAVRADDTLNAIRRSGVQRTYVFFRDGVQTIALRPGFEGRIDDFGMLIPFPSPPAVRKIDDETFAHMEGTLAPPQIDVYFQSPVILDTVASRSGTLRSAAPPPQAAGLEYHEVRVVNQEAVGMYEVAVLEAGSPAALSRWMGEHGYRYPEGMDDVTAEYVSEGWCFVAIKARVGAADGVAPRPGIRDVNPQLPSGSSFTGHVQGMGFRFFTDEPVVPMRLSVFNGADPQNVVYMLSDRPMTLAGVPLELVAGQLSGEEVYARLHESLTVRYHQGQASELQPVHRAQLEEMQDPTPYVRAARDLFASDLLAARTQTLSLGYEEAEKHLLNVSESLGMRGPEVDALHAVALTEDRARAIDGALDDVREMHLTVIDGVLPGALLASENLTFNYYRAPSDTFHQRSDPLRPSNLTMTVYR